MGRGSMTLLHLDWLQSPYDFLPIYRTQSRPGDQVLAHPVWTLSVPGWVPTCFPNCEPSHLKMHCLFWCGGASSLPQSPLLWKAGSMSQANLGGKDEQISQPRHMHGEQLWKLVQCLWLFHCSWWTVLRFPLPVAKRGAQGLEILKQSKTLSTWPYGSSTGKG